MPINWWDIFNFTEVYLFSFIHWLPSFFLPERTLAFCLLLPKQWMKAWWQQALNPVWTRSYCKICPEHIRSYSGTSAGSLPGCLRTACNVGYIATDLHSVFQLKTKIRNIKSRSYNFICTCAAFSFHRSRLDYTQLWHESTWNMHAMDLPKYLMGTQCRAGYINDMSTDTSASTTLFCFRYIGRASQCL